MMVPVRELIFQTLAKAGLEKIAEEVKLKAKTQSVTQGEHEKRLPELDSLEKKLVEKEVSGIKDIKLKKQIERWFLKQAALDKKRNHGKIQ